MTMFDLHDAVRGLRRDRLYAAITIVTLALSIGATTAVFSIVNGVLLKPLAYRESHQLVTVHEVWKQLADVYPTVPANRRHFHEWRNQARSFESLAEYLPLAANMTGGGEPAQLTVVHTSGTLFDVLRLGASIGRTLARDDERKEAPPVAVISDALWRRRFGASRAAVGQPIVLDGKPYTIVGVLPPGAEIPGPSDLGRGMQLTTKDDAFVPFTLDLDEMGWVGDHNNAVVGRLKTGVTVAQAAAELNVLQGRISAIATEEAHEPVTLSALVTPLSEAVVGSARRGLWLLLGSIAAVLLIACANLANLSLTRTLARLRDAAIRSALGASLERLVGRVVLEQLLLAAAGGALGLLVARAVLDLFVRTAPVDLPRVGEIVLDGRVLAFAAIVSIVTGLLVAMLPAWRLAARDVQGSLRAGGLGTTTDRSGQQARGMLLTLQVALSVMLLVVTALLTASFVRLLHVDRGFSPDRVLTVTVALPVTRYAEAPARIAAYDRVLEGIHALPGVEAVTWTSLLPLRGDAQVNGISPEGDARPRWEQPTANYRFVAPEFFKTLGMPVLRGRSFAATERNPNRPAPALMSERTAARVWPGQDPLGKRFSRGQPNEQPFEVVGIVPDARTTSIDAVPPLMVYVPYWWRSRASGALMIHTAVDPTTLVASIRRAIWQVDPDAAIGDARPLEELVDVALGGRRYQMQLFVAFGGVALLIVVIGVYAVTAYGVSRRRREMNIRAALGAGRSQVLGLVVRQGFFPVVAGLAVGAAGALAIATAISSLLFEVRARDPLVIAAVVAVVGGIGLLACTVAARQGLALNPAAALREE